MDGELSQYRKVQHLRCGQISRNSKLCELGKFARLQIAPSVGFGLPNDKQSSALSSAEVRRMKKAILYQYIKIKNSKLKHFTDII